MWTYQEIVNSGGTNVSFDFGARRCKWKDLYGLSYALDGVALDGRRHILDTNFTGMMSGWAAGWAARRHFVSRNPGVQVNSRSLPLAPEKVLNNALTATHERRCVDPRDKIFALLGLWDMRLTAESIQIFADYSMTTEELWFLIVSRYEQLCLKARGLQLMDGESLSKFKDRVMDMSSSIYLSLSLDDLFHGPESLGLWVWARNRSQKDPRGHAISFPLNSGGEVSLSESWFFNQFLNNVKDVWQHADGDWPWHGGEDEFVDFAGLLSRIGTTGYEQPREQDSEAEAG